MTNNLKPLELCVVIQHKENADNTSRYLTKEESTNLFQTIGQNIAAHYPNITDSALIGIGSIYHLNQIIRPNFPIYTQLFELSKMRIRAKNFKPSIIGIGTEEGQFEIDVFNKEQHEFSEVLQVVPFSILRPDNDETDQFYALLENELINNAHLSQNLPLTLNKLFNLEIENISIATLSDLNGLFASQLIQIGLEELWDIMKAVIFNLDACIATLGSGHILYWKLDEVAILTAHESIFSSALKNYKQTHENYSITTKRLEHLFTSHKIPYIKNEIIDPSFVIDGLTTIEQANSLLNQHIKAL